MNKFVTGGIAMAMAITANAAATLMKIEGYGLTRRRGEAESAENENGGKIRNGGSFVLGDNAQSTLRSK